ncbi:unnamed protein product [Discosporangium mesarthrocarpum]
MEGFRLGQKIEGKCGMRASMTAELVFDSIEVPRQNLVGEENRALLCMMRNLEIERLVLAAMSLGIARRCVEVMNKYAQERKAFGTPINHFGQIQRHIADSYAEFMAGRSYTYSVANRLDMSSMGNVLDADGTKLYCSTMAKNVADRAMQTESGAGQRYASCLALSCRSLGGMGTQRSTRWRGCGGTPSLWRLEGGHSRPTTRIWRKSSPGNSPPWRRTWHGLTWRCPAFVDVDLVCGARQGERWRLGRLLLGCQAHFFVTQVLFMSFSHPHAFGSSRSVCP